MEPQVNIKAGKDERGYYMRTFTGKQLHFDHVEDHDFDIEDIAHALSLRVRWTGHVRGFFSIAQHSVQVAMLLPPELRKAGLLHDGNEAYLPDFCSPLKWWLRDVKGETSMRELELRVDAAIAKKFGLPWPRDPRVKVADITMLATESRDLMPPGSRETAFMGEPMEEELDLWGWRRAKANFLDMFEQYK